MILIGMINSDASHTRVPVVCLFLGQLKNGLGATRQNQFCWLSFCALSGQRSGRSVHSAGHGKNRLAFICTKAV